MSHVLHFLGRTHPLVLHLPIGLLFGSVTLEIVALRARTPLPDSVTRWLGWLTALSAVASATAGWLLAHFETYDSSVVDTHRWLGVAVAACTLARAATMAAAPGWSRVLLFLSAAVVVPAGHFGATITHGEGFLTAPFETRTTPPAVDNSYEARIAPLFAARCTSCHGATKQKGELALHDIAAILRGGASGPILVAGSPQTSELVRRLRLPITDEDHMPPAGKGQPSTTDIDAVEAWIAAGAPHSTPSSPASGAR